MRILISVIIPANNEAAVIRRCLGPLVKGYQQGEIEILVVCNGCSDNTAEIARSFGEPVRVIETRIPSKTNALNLGDAAAKGFPRVYLDADVVINLASIRKLAAALEEGAALATAPRPVDVFLPGTRWPVRAYYRLWATLPYVQEGMIAAGVYVLSREGRKRFEDFPDVIADDGYVRLLFEPAERLQVADAVSEVYAPLTLRDLLKIRTRSRLGVLQLRNRYPQLVIRETKTKNYKNTAVSLLCRPSLYLSAALYVYVVIASRLKARRRIRKIRNYKWERDDSSRQT